MFYQKFVPPLGKNAFMLRSGGGWATAGACAVLLWTGWRWTGDLNTLGGLWAGERDEELEPELTELLLDSGRVCWFSSSKNTRAGEVKGLGMSCVRSAASVMIWREGEGEDT